jgi:hypothetical protein
MFKAAVDNGTHKLRLEQKVTEAGAVHTNIVTPAKMAAKS